MDTRVPTRQRGFGKIRGLEKKECVMGRKLQQGGGWTRDRGFRTAPDTHGGAKDGEWHPPDREECPVLLRLRDVGWTQPTDYRSPYVVMPGGLG